MKTTYKIFQRTNFVKKNGENPICLRLTINRKSKIYTLNISCTQEHWNKDKFCVRKANRNSEKLNKLINCKKLRTEEILFNYDVKNKLMTFVDFEKEFFAPVFKDNSFHDYVSYSIKKTEGIFSKDTIRTHLTQASKLKKFRPNLSLSEISFHYSRHTFAVCSLELGMGIEYVSSLLGHKDLKTTQIYAKILDYKKIEAMKKWENR